MADTEFTSGLHDLGEDCFAWIEADGGWGLSNAGLVVGAEASLLVDTLFTLPMTQRMLDGMAPVTNGRPITVVVNTHANGDHWYGNQLVAGAEIITSTATAEEMQHSGPDLVAAVLGHPGTAGDFAREAFASIDWAGIVPTFPSRTFDDEVTIDVGGRVARLVNVGPAHTTGDTVVHIPDAGVVYTGDILFIGGTPIAWAGPISNTIRACERILDLDAGVVVPGHGPVTRREGVREVRDYYRYVEVEANRCFDGGLDPWEAAMSIPLNEFASLRERGRLIQNVRLVYKERDPESFPATMADVFGEIGRLERHYAASYG